MCNSKRLGGSWILQLFLIKTHGKLPAAPRKTVHPLEATDAGSWATFGHRGGQCGWASPTSVSWPGHVVAM